MRANISVRQTTSSRKDEPHVRLLNGGNNNQPTAPRSNSSHGRGLELPAGGETNSGMKWAANCVTAIRACV
ncbi:hypothetical protein KCP70_02735 [Salmonella enterica subsp. enterica]|nr:hypothetical protein KCP70_02735 [Salmonella enterica subsp. enterica]